MMVPRWILGAFAWARRAGRQARVLLRKPTTARARRRPWVLIAGLVALWIWQLPFYRRPELSASSSHRYGAAMGLRHQQEFVYFYYYLGLYPLAAENGPGAMSLEGARQALATRGPQLTLEVGSPLFGPLRIGDHGRIWLYMLDALWKASPAQVSVRPANALAFLLSLMAVWTSLWWLGRPGLGLLIVALAGSSPFQRFEVYANDNVFGWGITTALLLIALYAPLLDPHGPRVRWRWVVPILAGFLLGSVRHIRSEPTALVLGALAASSLVTHLRPRQRLIAAAVLLGAFVITTSAWGVYFTQKIRAANAVAESAGGFPHPRAQDPAIHHNFWMAVWDGLGDYGADRGYAWSDRDAHTYARDALRAEYGVEYPPWDGKWTFPGSYHDAKKHYVRVPFELPHYEDVLRNKVLSDIVHHPLWYARVLIKRADAILRETTPVVLRVRRWQSPAMPSPLWLFPVWIALLAVTRCRLSLGLMVLALPLSLPAWLVYSKQGTTYLSLFPVMGTALLVWHAALALRWAVRRSPALRALARPGRVSPVSARREAPPG